MADNTLLHQRDHFQRAINALKTNQLPLFYHYQKTLKAYPLRPYLDYLYLRHRLEHVRPVQITRFLNRYSDTFFARRLRGKWLEHLANHQQWQLFLVHYHTPQPASRQCLYIQALIATGQEDKAFQETIPLWLIGRSQDAACDPVFSYWQNKQQLTDDWRWHRIRLALYNNQFSLARYLARSLTNPEPATALIARWKHAHLHPSAFLRAHTSVPVEYYPREMLQHALLRLAYQDPDQAHHFWQKLSNKSRLRPENRIMIQKTIARHAALDHHPSALSYFADLPNSPWRIRAALWQQDWAAAHIAIQDLNKNLADRPIWRYWLAKSLWQQGQKPAARHIFHTLAQTRDFYGFLSADEIHQPYQMNHHPLVCRDQEINTLRQQPAVQRLREFFAQGMMLEARRQAYALRHTLSERSLQCLASLTHQWGWHHQTIAILGQIKYWDALDLRFPLVFNHSVLRAGQHHGLDPSWILGIARQESAFNPRAHSPVGALGMMQLMPATGKRIARLLNQPLKHTAELLTPERNIQLGSAYLHHLFLQFQRHPVLATAAYNAGPKRIQQWLPDHPLPADIWIENIPFRETRRYVKNVLSYTAIFDYQRKQIIPPLSTRMPAIPEKKR